MTCKYCQEKNVPLFTSDDDYEGYYVSICPGNKLHITAHYEKYCAIGDVYLPINYCPMCGEMLIKPAVRCVPEFVGEWKGSNSYTPLQIVQYEDEFYIAREYIDPFTFIFNSLYWLPLCNGEYNAIK